MPILDKHNVVDFHNYVQRKVREGIPDWETSLKAVRLNGTVKASEMKSIAADLPSDYNHSTILSKRIRLLIEVSLVNNIVIKIKLKNKVHNLASIDTLKYIEKEALEYCIRNKLNTNALSRLTEKAITSATASRFLNPLRPSSEEHGFGVFTTLMIYSYTNRNTNGLVFPSGNLSNKE